MAPQNPPRVLPFSDPFEKRKPPGSKKGNVGNFGSSWVRFWVVFGTPKRPKRPQEASKRPPRAPKSLPKASPEGPIDPQEAPKRHPRRPKSSSKGSQEVLGKRGDPKMLQKSHSLLLVLLSSPFFSLLFSPLPLPLALFFSSLLPPGSNKKKCGELWLVLGSILGRFGHPLLPSSCSSSSTSILFSPVFYSDALSTALLFYVSFSTLDNQHQTRTSNSPKQPPQ